MLAPCALGGVLNDDTIPRLACRIVAGAANNQLLEDRHGAALHARGILYAPDYVINAGGLINIAQELRPGGYDRGRALAQVEAIGTTLAEVFERAARAGLPTHEVADRVARERIAAARRRRSRPALAARCPGAPPPRAERRRERWQPRSGATGGTSLEGWPAARRRDRRLKTREFCDTSSASDLNAAVPGRRLGPARCRHMAARFLEDRPALSADPRRAAIRAAHRADEAACVAELLELAAVDDRTRARIRARALELAGRVRRAGGDQLGVEAFLHEYQLSTREGVMLMCLAEALLRIPDAETADRLIRDKLSAGDWARHLGRSGSLLVNASTWGLMLTGRLVRAEPRGATPIPGRG